MGESQSSNSMVAKGGEKNMKGRKKKKGDIKIQSFTALLLSLTDYPIIGKKSKSAF